MRDGVSMLDPDRFVRVVMIRAYANGITDDDLAGIEAMYKNAANKIVRRNIPHLAVEPRAEKQINPGAREPLEFLPKPH